MKKGIMSYEVTALPNHILHAQLYRVEDIPGEEEIEIEEGCESQVVEVRIGLYRETGEIIEMASQMVVGSKVSLKRVLTIVPRKMLEKWRRREEED